MKTYNCVMLSALAMLMILSSAAAQPPDTLWTRVYGGDLDDRGESVQQTADGGYILTGCTKSYGAGNYDFYLVKTNAAGDTLWTRAYGGSTVDWARSVQQITDGGYIVAGYTQSYGAGSKDFYMIKTDSVGDTLWTRTYGGSNDDQAYSVQQTTDGGYILSGSTMSYGAGSKDFYLIKTDPAGDILWTRTYGGNHVECARDVQQTTDGGYIVAGYTYSYGAGAYDVYLIKTDSNGDSLWTRVYGGEYNDQGFSVQQTTDGGYVVAGSSPNYSAGVTGVYLIKTDSAGDTLWTRTFSGSVEVCGYSIQQTSDGGYIVAGDTYTFGAVSWDPYLVRTDAAGDSLWTHTYIGSVTSECHSVEQTTDGGYILAGYTSDYGAGLFDIYLIRLEAEAPPDLSVTLTPHDPPIQIPASGGSFQFDIAIENTTASPITADAWIEAIPPGGAAVPLMVRTDITFPANATITRPDLTQNVPAGAPPGMYTYVCSVGEIFVSVIDFDQFTFEKLATGEGPATVARQMPDWNLSGWEDEVFVSTRTPEKFAFIGAYPNPFNPTTVLSFELRVTSFVNLGVYDLSGRKVVELVNGWREAGGHDVIFDGSGLTSGIYIYQLSAGDLTASGKMVLMK